MKSEAQVNKLLKQLRNDYEHCTIQQVKREIRAQIEMLKWVLQDYEDDLLK